MGATRNTGYLENLIQYDASDNVAIATSVNPSYKVTLGGSLLGTSAVFSSTITSSNEFRGLNGYGIRSYSAATATGNNILFGAGVFASFDGIYQSSGSTNDFGIWTNGGTINDPKFVIKNGGNVGIGTTSPNKGGVNRALTLNAATSTNASYELSVNDILQGSLYTNISDTSVRLANFNSGDIVFVTGASSTERMRIDSVGRLVFNPASINDLNNSIFANSNGYFYHEGGTNGLILSNNSVQDCRIRIEDANNIQFETNSVTRMVISSGGQFQFGNYAPANTWTALLFGSGTASQSYGLKIIAGSNSSDVAFQIRDKDDTSTRFQVRGDGVATFSSSVTAVSTIVSGAGEDGSAGPVMRLTSTNSNSGSRNWAIVNTWDNYGDLTFRVSSLKDGNALSAGNSVMAMLRNGNVLINTTVDNGYRLNVSGNIYASSSIVSNSWVFGQQFATTYVTVSGVGTSFVNSGITFPNTTATWLVSIQASGDGNMYSSAMYVVTAGAWSKTLALIGGPSNHFGNGTIVAQLNTSEAADVNLQVRRTTSGSATVTTYIMKIG